MNAKKCLAETEKNEIESLIANIESKSSAEIVCAIATESGRYDRAESIAGIFFALLFLFAGHIILNKVLYPGSSWGDPNKLSILCQGGLVVGGFVFGTLLASYWHGLRQLFCFKTEMNSEVERSAQTVFCSRRIYSTKTGGGVLIYVSLFEQRLRIITDSNVKEKLPDDHVEKIKEDMIPLLKRKDIAAALKKSILEIGTILEREFPIQASDENELANRLVLIHPRP